MKGCAAVAWSVFKGFHDLGYTVARLGGAAGAYTNEDWVGFGANLGAAIGKFGWYARDKIKFLAEGLKKPGATPTPTAIVDVAMVLVTVLDLLNGILPADKGDKFALGKSEFENMQHLLEAAVADPAKWSGTGAEAYNTQNNIMLQLSKDMQDYDKQMGDLLKEHGTRVQKMHTDYAIMLMSLVAAQLVAMVIWSLPWLGGPPASIKFQLVTVIFMSFAIFCLQGEVCLKSEQKSAKIADLNTKYAEAGTKAEAVKNSGSFDTIVVRKADEVKVSSFAAIRMSGPPPTFSTVVSMAKTESSGQPEHPLLESITGDGSQTDAEDVAPTPSVLTPPTLSQVTQASGQLAQLSGAVSQPVSSFNQTVGQIAQTAQQAGRGAAPAEKAVDQEEALDEEATPVGVEGAGAGADGAERAPVEAAAGGTEQAREPTPAERAM